MSDTLLRDDFVKYLDSEFQVEFTVGNFTKVKLIEVSELKTMPRQESFSLVFLAPNDTPTEPNTFRVTNEKLGELEIFLTPFLKDEKGVSFEALFSRLVP